jgi:hypothetical protein
MVGTSKPWSFDGRLHSTHWRRLSLAGSLLAALITPVSLVLGTTEAGAQTTAPKNVTFNEQGQNPYSPSGNTNLGFNSTTFPICGIGNSNGASVSTGLFAPLETDGVDWNYDDPYVAFNVVGPSVTEEGNYTDSESVGFNPSSGLTPGNAITVTLPHPSEPYSDAGSILPPDAVPVANPANPTGTEFGYPGVTEDTVSATKPVTVGSGSQTTVTVNLAPSGDDSATPVQLKVWNPYGHRVNMTWALIHFTQSAVTPPCTGRRS